MLHYTVTILTTSAMLMHAVLGCCYHHAHGCEIGCAHGREIAGAKPVQTKIASADCKGHDHSPAATCKSHGHVHSHHVETADHSPGEEPAHHDHGNIPCDEADCCYVPATTVKVSLADGLTLSVPVDVARLCDRLFATARDVERTLADHCASADVRVRLQVWQI